MQCSRIDVLLKPVWNGERIARMDVLIRADLQANEGDTLFSINKRITNKLFIPIDGDIGIYDTCGTLPCTIQAEAQMHADLAHYIAGRSTQGTVSLNYTALPQAAGANPCFDLGYEQGGINGSGMTFLPIFRDEECRLTVDWDTACLPPGFRCVWTYGEGKTAVTGLPSMLTQAFYYAGKLKSAESGRFGFYWLESPDYDAAAIAEWNRDTYGLLARFFRDEDALYRIFVRRAADHKPGGTALGRSYMMIYPSGHKPEMDKFLYAHEMVHNWIHIHDEPFGACTWYMEGMAEFYSAALLWHNGLITRAELVAEMNRRAKQYYENPRISVSNEEAGTMLFSDRDITRVPYGRGLFYLMKVDAQIRSATDGHLCLDDLMFQMMKRYQKNPQTGNQDWLELLCEILGNHAKEEFEQMRSGMPFTPPKDCFDHALQAYHTTGTVRGTDIPCDIWQFQ